MLSARRKRKFNPSTTAWVLFGSAVAVVAGGVTYAVLRRRALPIAPDPDPALPHAGQPGHVWPRSDLFPDLSAFGDALEQLGYDVGEWATAAWSIESAIVRSAISAFQDDYNAVRKTIEQPPTPALAITGALDDDTVHALAYVLALQDIGEDWPLIVYNTRQAGIS